MAAVAWHLFDPAHSLCKDLSKKLGVEAEWLRKWFSFCLLLHDLGKFARSFQNLSDSQLSPKLVVLDKSCIYNERHDTLGFLLWKEKLRKRLTDIFDTDKLSQQIEAWLQIVCGHHGKPPKKSSNSSWGCWKEEDEKAAESYIREVARLWLPDLSPLGSINKDEMKHLSWQLAGYAVLADWLGSRQEDFPYHNERMPLPDYWEEKALPAAESVLKSNLPRTSPAAKFESVQKMFSFIEELTPLQEFAQDVELVDSPQLFLLEDLTGAGKTEAAMILVHRLMGKGLAKGVYVGLPTMATANAMYERLAKSYDCLFEVNKETKPSLVLAHSARRLSDAFVESVTLKEQEGDQGYDKGESSASAYCNAWLADNNKKALLADVGIGTIDQALFGVIPVAHQSLRLLGLSNKVLLVDEVHAYDSYTRGLLSTLLKAHARQGGSAILLSATLPQCFRKELLTGFAKGLGVEPPEISKENYPLATHFSASSLEEKPMATRHTAKRSLQIVNLDGKEKVLQLIQNSIASGKCICWIRNTVKAARQAYYEIAQAHWSDSSKLTLFHSRFAMIDRRKIESDVLKRFGKESDEKERKGQVLVATQVVEQSLDLDFDIMITDLAPLDLIVQRAGRLQRHTRDSDGNPVDCEQRGEARLYLLSPDPERVEDQNWLKDLLPGTQAVYEDSGKLWLTAKTLLNRKCLSMPEDLRSLVEAIYGEGAEEQIPEVLKEATYGARNKEKSGASLAGFNKLKLEKGYTYPSAENWNDNIPTRLGEDDTTVALACQTEDGKLIPYASKAPCHKWSLSQLNVPQYEWNKVRERIPSELREKINELQKEQATLRWVKVLPLLGDTEKIYRAKDGWDIERQ